MAEAINKNEVMEDSLGRFVPLHLVKEVHKLRDALVRELVGKSRGVSKEMQEFRNSAMDDVEAFVELSAEKYGAKIGGKKGNVSLTSYDGRLKVEVSINDRIVFGEEIHAAKSLIDECLREWTEDGPDELRVIVDDAFQVDKHGRINTRRVLALRNLEISHEKWKRAMDAVGDSIQVDGSKSYLRLYERENSNYAWRQVALDMSAM